MVNSRFTNQQDRNARPVRWFVVLVASILLHLMIFNLADGRLGVPAAPEEPVVVTTTLIPPPAPPVAVATPTPKAKPRRARAPARAPAPVALAPTTEETVGPVPEQNVQMADSNAGNAPPSNAAPATEESPASRYKIDPPPSAQLLYDVRVLHDGQNWYGAGTFNWESGAGRYSITGEASVTIVFKITVLNFKSEGKIGDFGIAPELYSEKPWRKSLMNTHFQHENQLISFSASTATYPYKGGEQDRASIIWQLAGIGRGDAQQFAPGATFDVVVAGTRNADTWRMQVVGQEETDTAYGKTATWHIVRQPSPESRDQRLDVWLAPQKEWYPVRVLYTQANGDNVDLTLSALKPAPAR
jgi:hypothetical protein